MTRRARFHRLAEREFTEAAEYFERESPALGAASTAEVERCVAGIVEHPESGRVLVGAIRRRLVRRFPYSVLHSIKPDHIRVLAVMHAKRRPMYWVGRDKANIRMEPTRPTFQQNTSLWRAAHSEALN